ncbi:c-Myc-binding protein homolog [Tribolium madens]|uniref:c-Myc-binding protein homolog n=1 Tax=Tribolium madens TaxID=41895 RepID=UPI001CF753A4|nr:c-Myc-binding protein homolog [Tribolium madens]XP_044259769.1 c-Myc-binding protein homolog [Tribolium madens]
MSNPTFKPSEGKREEFRKYLEKNGVMDALTKVLVNLYEEPEKPEDALEYIRDRLAMQAGIETFTQMKTKIEEYQARVDALTQELEELRISMEPPPPADEEGAPVEEGFEPTGGDENPPEEAVGGSEEAPAEQPPENAD